MFRLARQGQELRQWEYSGPLATRLTRAASERVWKGGQGEELLRW